MFSRDKGAKKNGISFSQISLMKYTQIALMKKFKEICIISSICAICEKEISLLINYAGLHYQFDFPAIFNI